MDGKVIDDNKVVIASKKRLENQKLTSEDLAILYSFFLSYVKNERINNTLMTELGEEQYTNLVSLIKKDNDDYYSFMHIVNANPQLIQLLFENGVLVRNLKTIDDYKKELSSRNVDKCVQLLSSVTNYCLKNNYPGEAAYAILVDYYDSPLEVGRLVAKLIDDHRQQLQLNYLIKILKK